MSEAQANYEARRRKAKPWRRWYSLKAWRLRRARQLHAQPWCEPCARAGRTRAATVANHNPPHRGVWRQFISGPLESVCKECHDSLIQREEIEGFSRAVDDDGWPVDPQHPFHIRSAANHAERKPKPKRRP